MSEDRADSGSGGLVRAALELRPLVLLWNRSPLAGLTGEATTRLAWLLVVGVVLSLGAQFLDWELNIVFWLAGVVAILALPLTYVWNRTDVGAGGRPTGGWQVYLPVLGVALVVAWPVLGVGIALPVPFIPLLVPLPVALGLLAILARPAAGLWNRTYPGGYFGTVNGWQLFALATGFLFILYAPYLQTGMLRALGLACVWAIFAMSWDMQSGYTGYISFGHSALSGAAGYTVGLLAMHGEGLAGLFPVGSPTAMWTAIPLAIVVTVVLGLVLGVITLRLQGPYFSLITLVAVLLFTRLLIGFSAYTNGLNPIGPAQGLEAFSFEPLVRYYFVAIPLVLVALGLVVLARSNVGLILMVIRENESAVSAAGLSPTRFKLWSFVISAVPMAIGGVLLAYFDGRVDPQTFVVVTNSIEMIAIAVLGGMSSIFGPLFAAFAFIPLSDEILSGLLEPGLRGLALWTIVILVLVFARRGVFRHLWHALGSIGGDGT